MRTLNTLLFVLLLASFLMAQIDSTVTETEAIEELPTAEVVVEEADTRAAPTEEIVEADTVSNETAADYTGSIAVDTAGVDTMMQEAQDMADTAVEMLLAVELKPVRIVGLMYDGPLYYWSNDNLAKIGFSDKSYLTVEDPSLIAIKAKNCMDVVCHLLATDISHADFVVISTARDSSLVQVYEIGTRANIIEAPAGKALSLFVTFLKENGYEALFKAAPPVVAPPADDSLLLSELALKREKAKAIRLVHFRKMSELFGNPGNLARTHLSHTTWNIVPDFRMRVRNSLLTPGWYKDWWTTGGVWDAGTKNDYLSTLRDENIAINVRPEFQTILGFRIGRFGFNISGASLIKLTLPANLLGLPMQDILFDEPIENAGLELEAIPFSTKSTLSYAHPLTTAYGDLKLGVNLNLYKAAGYMKMVSDDFTVLMTPDSVHVTASGEGWITVAGAEGHLDDPNLDNLESGETLSDLTVGFDLGMILDLRDRLDQEVEVHLSLRNIGAKYKWSNLTHETWTFKQSTPGLATGIDSIEQYQITDRTVIGTEENFSVDVPTVLNIRAYYQPVPNLLLGAGIEKAFTDEVRLGFSPDLEFSLQANYYPVNWFDISYSLIPRYGDPSHTLGTGLHFGFLDAGVFVSLLNGLNSEAKGAGFGFYSSLHF